MIQVVYILCAPTSYRKLGSARDRWRSWLGCRVQSRRPVALVHLRVCSGDNSHIHHASVYLFFTSLFYLDNIIHFDSFALLFYLDI
jgi:hypothetical protein